MNEEDDKLLSTLRARLQQPLPGREAQERMTGRVLPMPDALPEDARQSGVLALLFPKDGVLHLLFMRRTEDGRAHSGQISFPGGRFENSDANLQETALREAWEEVGILPETVDVLGALTPLYIPVSNFLVHPFVGYSAAPPQYALSDAEVVEVLEVPLRYMLDAAIKIQTEVRPSSVPGLVLNVPAYKLPAFAEAMAGEARESILWGATAMIFSELEACLK